MMPRVIDLTLPLRPGMRGVEFEDSHVLERDGWNAKTLHLYSHCGTHMDAPRHFELSGQTIDQISVEQCIVPAWVIDLTGIAPRSLIGVEHLGETGRTAGPGEGLLIRTGWSERVLQPDYRTALPRISVELAQWCVERKIALIGVEPPSVADVNDRVELATVHKTFLQAGIIIVEGLANLEAITKPKVTFMAFPLKIVGGDGSPVRAVAIEE